MAVSVEPIDPNIGGRLSGLALVKPLALDEVKQLEAALDEFAALVFHRQELTDDQQKALSLSFGAIENARGGSITKPQDRRLSHGLNDVSNLGKDGKPLAARSGQSLFNTANMLWHSDSSFRAVPARYSILSAITSRHA
jgi:alpha-ketoglutarate-dependent 2,4-dichlorophenoxyacetate dioxygenase